MSHQLRILTLVGCLLLAMGIVSAKSTPNKKKPSTDSFPIRASEDLELNCPSLTYRFPAGTLQCESCRAVGVALAYLIQHRSMDILEASESVCPALFQYAQLRQASTGLRYWDLSAMEEEDGRGDGILPLSSNIDKVHPRGAPWPVVDQDGNEPENPLQVTYHTPEERDTLPCAQYLLKKYCEEYMATYDEQLEDNCFEEYRVALREARKQEAANSAQIGSRKKKRKLPSEVAAEQLAHCLTVPQCDIHVAHCHSRMLAMKEEEEIQLFKKYNGRYGAQKFPYVKDRTTRSRFERNPYAKGGEKESENELFNVPLEEL